MGYIEQASSPVDNPNKFIISMWVRVPGETFDTLGQAIILEFGENIHDNLGTNYIKLVEGNPGVYCQFWGEPVLGPGRKSHPTTLWTDQIFDVALISSGPLITPAHAFSFKNYGFFTFATALYSGGGTYNTDTDLLYAMPRHNIAGSPFHNAWLNYQNDVGNWTLDGSPGFYPPLGYVQMQVIGAPYGPVPSPVPGDYSYFGFSTKSLSGSGFVGTIVRDAWNHILISGDSTATARVDCAGVQDDFTTTVVQTNKFHIAVNDVDFSPVHVKGVSPEIEAITFPKGSYLPRLKWYDHDTGVFKQDDFDFGPGIPNDPPGLTFFSHVAAPFNINTNGWAFGIPAPGWDSAQIGKVQVAEVQIFLGQSIDTSDVSMRRLFIDSSRKPVSPNVPAAAFGPPAYMFRRNKNKRIRFHTNGGTGGEMVLVSAATDYTPGPGQ